MGSKKNKKINKIQNRRQVISNYDIVELQKKIALGKKLSVSDIFKIKSSNNSEIKRQFFKTTTIADAYFSYHSNKAIIKNIKNTDFTGFNIHLESLTLMKELEWFLLELLSFKDEINYYLGLKSEFEDSFFRRNCDFGEHILAEIKENLGFSLWEFENELLIKINKEKRNKSELIEEVGSLYQDDKPYSSFNVLLLSLIVDKISDESDSFLYYQTISKKIKGTPEPFKYVFSYFLLLESYPLPDEKEVSKLLVHSTMLSIVDRFNILVNLLLNSPENIKKKIRDNFSSILNQFDDYKIKKFLSERYDLLDNLNGSDIDFIETQQQLSVKNYKNNSNLIGKVIKEYYLSYSTVDLLSRYVSSQNREEEEELYKDLKIEYIPDFVDIINYYVKIKDFSFSSDHISKLYYYTRKYSSFDLLNQFRLHLRALSTGALDDRRIELYDKYTTLSCLKYTIDTIDAVKILNKNIDFKIYLDDIFSLKVNNIKSVADVELGLSLLRNIKLDINSLNNFSQSIEDLQLPVWYLEEVKYFIFNYYLDSNDLQNAIAELSDAYFRRKNSICIYPLDKMRELLDQETLCFDLSKIDVPIVAKLCNSSKLKYIFEDYLEENMIDYPSKMKLETNDENKVRFMLESICTRELLSELTMILESEEQVTNERLSILSKLNESNVGEFDNKYAKEISELSQEVLLKKLVRSVNRSKLTVDSEKIYQKNKDELGKFFNDFIDTKEALLLGYFTNDQLNENKQLLFIGLKEYNPKMRALERLFTKVVIKFLFDDDGLDSYLSTRVRHGTLQGQIRRAFSNSNLITEKISDTSNIYAPNEYIKKIVEPNYDKISSILNDFSESVDNEITRIKQELLQIKYGERGIDSGIFNLSESFDDIENEVYDKVKVLNDQKQIYDKIVEYIWKKIDKKVLMLQNMIKTDITKIFIDKLTNLEHRLDKSGLELSIIRNNIASCKTDIQNSLEEIAGWFERSQISDDTVVHSEDLISVSKNIISKINSDFEKITFNLELNKDYKISSRELPFYIDILLILFNNAMKHSGVKSDDLIINASIIENKDGSTIKFSNNYLSEKEDLIRESIETLRQNLDKISSSDNIPRLTKEGGSGYHKLFKIIKINFIKDPFFEFSISKDKFEVIIRMEG